LSQEKYIQDLLDRASLTNHQTAETPMELNVHLTPTDGEPLEDPTCYHHIVGSLDYLGVTRPDISYSVHILSQFIFAPTQIHYSHLLHVLRYLRMTISLSHHFSFHALYNSKHIVMLPGLVIPLTVILFLPIVFFLVVPSFLRLIQVLFRTVIIIAVICGFNPLRVTLPPLLTTLGVFPGTLDGDAR
jgi:hypothetical protein